MKSSVIVIMVATLGFAFPVCAGDFKTDEPAKVKLSGKVKDQLAKPVKGARVFLIDRRSGQKLSTKTDGAGQFQISHDRCQFETLVVMPPLKSGLAQATLSDIPANDGRRVLVSLKPGVAVTGRVIAAGKPLKGVTVRAVPKSADIVHDGGEAQTDGKGGFCLILTPGDKYLEVIDVVNDSERSLHRQRQLVTTGGAVPDIVVPSTETAGVDE